MSETIGTARIDVVVDADKAQADIKALERGVAQFGGAAEQQFNKSTAATKKYADSLLRQIDMQGKSRLEQIAYNAQLKVGGALGDEIAKKALAAQAALGGQAAAVEKTSKAFSGTAKTARELQFATRGLPAQFTDIAVSLQSGQRPLNVLLQQGGQLKDMFGGIGPAFRAMAGYVVGLINPLTITAAAVGLLAVAWKQGESEAVGFNRAIIQTGNFARLTADDMAQVAARIDRTTEATAHSAAQAVAAVAQTGKFTAEQIGLVAKAAEQMRIATGQKIDETIAEFDKLRKDPVAAILDLNDKYHFLTETQLEQIKTLKDQGKEQEAVTQAMRVYANVVNERAPEITQNLGTIEKALHFIKIDALRAIDALRGIGREATNAERFNSLLTKLQELEHPSNPFSYLQFSGDDRIKEIQRVRAELKKLQDDNVAAAKAAQNTSTIDSGKARDQIEAEKEIDRLRESNLSKLAKQEAEEKRIRETGKRAKLDDLEIERLVAESRKRYNESLPKGRKEADPGPGILDRLERQIALNRAAAASNDTLTASERLQVEVQRELDKVGIKLTSSKRAQITLKLAELDATGKLAAQTEAETKAKEQLLRLTNQLKAEEDNRRSANEADLSTIQHGDDYLQRIRRRLEIDQDYARGLQQLRDRGVAEDSDSYQQQLRALQDARSKALVVEEDFQRRRVALMGDWTVGARAALEDFSATAANVAGATRNALNSAFENASDTLADFVTTGKANFADFAESVIKDFARMEARILLSKAFNWISSFLGGGTNAPGSTGFSGNGYSEAFANGGAFSHAPGLSAYSGGVYNSPHLFKFASGAGVFGEAGPEAIMPLKRGPNGKLGVQASGGGGDVILNVYGAQSTPKVETRKTPTGTEIDVMFDGMEKRLAGNIAAGSSPVLTALKGRTGLRDSR